MDGLSNVKDKLNEIIKFSMNLKLYNERTEKYRMNEIERQEIIKTLELSIDNIYYVFRSIINSLSHKGIELDDNKKVLEFLVNSYIISEKSKLKVHRLEKLLKEVLMKNIEDNKKFDQAIKKASEYIDDIIDEVCVFIH